MSVPHRFKAFDVIDNGERYPDHARYLVLNTHLHAPDGTPRYLVVAWPAHTNGRVMILRERPKQYVVEPVHERA